MELRRSLMKVRHVFLHLREHGRSLIVLQVHSFDFFRYGLTEVYSTAPSLPQAQGPPVPELGAGGARNSRPHPWQRPGVGQLFTGVRGILHGVLGRSVRHTA